jgi:transcriptional regulator with XRE-family HTH domain
VRQTATTLTPLTGLPGLRAAREAKLLTQVGLAGVSGVSRATIGELEAGKRNALFQTLRQLAAALDVPPETLQVRPRRSSRAQPARPGQPLAAVDTLGGRVPRPPHQSRAATSE